uniref:Predicted nucleic acid-binding protein, contains Zn-ribbon domain n=1 Tax=Candidatus Kentrum sp. TUN TaxID=2126343 RepID=A0A451A137_9GAMM|nr:MAG: Predicted nucleic acid-binding protein, contains Zn-ribbon domain [Candidatus Kentron sp. TUN]VFK60266.1 MAG: Predicted nucleic acid-binding protein, contains Zn-ribbon domain [Candidatus Kentron sp. TUN]VFK69719.1 MAG: Predicted nucleic acid-binding protein, contains Zn-ribbon domain [Candidatus Kentron sp. TUN]
MPTYVYETIPENSSTPPRRFEVEQRMADDPLATDPDTGLPVRRVISGGVGFLSTGEMSSSFASEPSAGSSCCNTGMCGCG